MTKSLKTAFLYNILILNRLRFRWSDTGTVEYTSTAGQRLPRRPARPAPPPGALALGCLSRRRAPRAAAGHSGRRWAVGAEGFTGADLPRRRGGAEASRPSWHRLRLASEPPFCGRALGLGQGLGVPGGRRAALWPGSGCGTLGTLPPLGELILWVPHVAHATPTKATSVPFCDLGP